MRRAGRPFLPPSPSSFFEQSHPFNRNLPTMHIVWTILIGFVVGLVARALKPGNDAAGFIVTTVIGVLGSVGATYVGQAMGWYTAAQGAGVLASVVGAIVLLVLWGMVKGRG